MESETARTVALNTVADAYAADADADAAYAAERKWQADKIREIIPCPFE